MLILSLVIKSLHNLDLLDISNIDEFIIIKRYNFKKSLYILANNKCFLFYKNLEVSFYIQET